MLAIGSSSTVGVGASTPSASYVARLETTLEGFVQGLDFDVVGRGLSGEVAQGAADRMKREVEETKPDLVVWQVGTNDALRHVGIDRFKTCLNTTLTWLADSKIDVVLIDPQYGDNLTKDAYYEQVVGGGGEIARENRVLSSIALRPCASCSANAVTASTSPPTTCISTMSAIAA